MYKTVIFAIQLLQVKLLLWHSNKILPLKCYLSFALHKTKKYFIKLFCLYLLYWSHPTSLLGGCWYLMGRKVKKHEVFLLRLGGEAAHFSYGHCYHVISDTYHAQAMIHSKCDDIIHYYCAPFVAEAAIQFNVKQKLSFIPLKFSQVAFFYSNHNFSNHFSDFHVINIPSLSSRQAF